MSRSTTLSGGARGARRRAVPLVLAALLSGCGTGADAPPNLILVCADTLRADYLGCYGFEGMISPHLDALARESVVFENCVTQAPWTKPATATLLTSLYPGTHGLTDHQGGFWSDATDDSPARRTGILPAEATTLAEVLVEHGYRTAGFTANSWLVRSFGFAQGFDEYDDFAARLDTHADEILANARRWLDHTEPSGRPFFLYLHFMDVHAPYDGSKYDYDELLGGPSLGADGALTEAQVPYNRWQNIERRPEWATDAMRHRVAYWRTRYATGVRALDRRLDAFFHQLRRSGVLDETVVVFTSDHGEHLFEHGDWSHGQNLYDHQLRIPLVIRDRGGRAGGRRVPELVELIDVMPTVLSLLGVRPPAGLQGRDLSRVFDGRSELPPGVGFATAVQKRPGMRSVRTATHKLIVDLDSGGQWLFDLRADPGEHDDASAEQPDVARELRNLLDEHLAEVAERGVIPLEEGVLSPEHLDRLEALGYQ